MSMREDLIEMKNELKEVKQESFAMELLKDSKKSNKRMVIAFTSVLIVISIFWFITICYLVYILNDIGKVTINKENNKQTISDIDTMNDNQIINGDYNGYSKSKD